MITNVYGTFSKTEYKYSYSVNQLKCTQCILFFSILCFETHWGLCLALQGELNTISALISGKAYVDTDTKIKRFVLQTTLCILGGQVTTKNEIHVVLRCKHCIQFTGQKYIESFEKIKKFTDDSKFPASYRVLQWAFPRLNPKLEELTAIRTKEHQLLPLRSTPSKILYYDCQQQISQRCGFILRNSNWESILELQTLTKAEWLFLVF